MWRHLPAGAHPLNAHFILHAAGRWNRPGVYGCLYTALTREGALAEYERYLQRAALTGLKPRELVTIEVTVEPVLDLTDEAVRAELGLSLETLVGEGAADIEACRDVADWARANGYRAIVAPSAASSGEKILAIYLEGSFERLGMRAEGRFPVP